MSAAPAEHPCFKPASALNIRRLVLQLGRRLIAFNPLFVDLPGCSINAALFLSQSLYWSERTASDGWFFKTRDDWTREIRLTRREQESARKALRECGVLEEKLHGLPGKLHFRVNCDRLAELLVGLEATETWAETTHRDGQKPPNLRAETAQPYKEAEITSEMTAESTNERENSRARPRPEPHLLPDDFELSGENYEVAKSLGIGEDGLRNIVEKFRDHYAAVGGIRADWHKALNAWMRRGAEQNWDLAGI